jgi:leucine dehydrogenase
MKIEVDGFQAAYRIELGKATAFLVVHAAPYARSFGGIRLRKYASDDAALADAKLLARAMTRKVLLAGIPAGGAKTVIRVPAEGWSVEDRAAGLRQLGEFIQGLEGLYHCGADLGFTDADEAALRSTCGFVAPRALGPWTARRVLVAMHAVCTPASVAVQGVGAVGTGVATSLIDDGVSVHGTDLDGAAVAAVPGLINVAPSEIYEVDCEVFSPCATGGVLDEETIARLRCRIVCGGANNPLAGPAGAEMLRERGIIYVPSVIANAGAVIKGASDALGESDRVEERMAGIAERVKDILEIAKREERSPQAVSHDLAERLLVLAFER